jgi:hypothetical protein
MITMKNLKKSNDYEKETELENLRHKNHVDEINLKLESEIKLENLKHNHELERARIKSAEIKRTIQMKNERF